MTENTLASLIQDLTSGQSELRSRAVDVVLAEAPGAEVAVPILLGYLRDPDPKVRDPEARSLEFCSEREAAAFILGWIGRAAEPAIDDLGRVLQNHEELPKTRERCGWALWHIGPSAIPVLVKTLETSDPVGRAAAARELCDFGPKAAPAIPSLIAALGDKEASVAGNVRSALVKIGTAAVAGLTEALSHHDPRLRVRASEVLLENEPFHSAAVRTAVSSLKCEQQDIRSNAASALYMDAGSHVELGIAEYVALLRDVDCFVRKFAAAGLRNIGPPGSAEAMPTLIAALDDDDYYVQVFAIQALGDLGPAARKVIPRLIAVVEQRLPTDVEAVEALGHMGPIARSALPALRSLQAEMEQTKCEHAGEEPPQAFQEFMESVAASIEAIEGKRPLERSISFTRATIPELIEALKSHSAITVVAASSALVRRGSAGVPALVQLLANGDKNVRSNALTALREIGPRATGAIPSLIQGLTSREAFSSTNSMRDLYALTLKHIGAAAIPFLKEAAKHGDHAVRQYVAATLEAVSQDSQ